MLTDDALESFEKAGPGHSPAMLTSMSPVRPFTRSGSESATRRQSFENNQTSVRFRLKTEEEEGIGWGSLAESDKDEE